MTRTVMCRKYQREMEGLAQPPFPGARGQKIFDSVSKQAWQEWLAHQTMLVNEKRLNLMDFRACRKPCTTAAGAGRARDIAGTARSYTRKSRYARGSKAFCDTLFSRTACRNVPLPVLDSPGASQLNTRLFCSPDSSVGRAVD